MTSITQLHAPRPHQTRRPSALARLLLTPIGVVAAFVVGIVAALALAAAGVAALGAVLFQVVSSVL